MIGGDYNQVFGTIKVGDETRYSIQVFINVFILISGKMG